jgi:ribosome-associated toxin RatA of RatAB toxin-antitoxin module
MAFEKVSTEVVLDGYFRKENAWNIISNYERYPQIMDNVDKVEVTGRNGEDGTSQWFISIEDAPLTWVEKDYFNPANYEIVFKSIEGDFDAINGCWTIRDNIDSGISIRFEIQYNLGIPVIEEVLGHILYDKMKSNMDSMMAAVKKELCSTARNERGHIRHAIGNHHACMLNDWSLNLCILNFSAGGMMTHFVPDIPKNGSLSLAGIMLDVAAIYANESQNRCHFVFRSPVEEELLKVLVSRLTLASGRLKSAASGPQEALVFGDAQEVPIRLLDLTRDGLSFLAEEADLPPMETFTVGNTAFPLREVIRDEGRNTVRIRFSDHLNDDQFRWMREKIRISQE